MEALGGSVGYVRVAFPEDQDRIPALKQFISDRNLNSRIDIQCIIERLEKGVITNGDVFVDSWDSMTSVVTIVYPPDAKRPFVRALSIDDVQLLKLLQPIIKIISTTMVLIGEATSIEYISNEMSPMSGNTDESAIVYSLDCDIPFRTDAVLPDGYKIAKIDDSDFELIRSKWSYSSNPQDADWFKHLSQKYGSVAVYTLKGEIVSWMLEDYGGAFLHLFTLPDHRHKGLAAVVVQEMVKRMLAEGRTPYCYIVEGNEASEKLFLKLGFKRLEGLNRNYITRNFSTWL